MSSVLSQDEINNLLSSFSDCDALPEKKVSTVTKVSEEEAKNIKIINFNSMQRLSLHLNDVLWNADRAFYKKLIDNINDNSYKGKLHYLDTPYENLNYYYSRKVLFIDSLRANIKECVEKRYFPLEDNYKAVTKEIKVFDNDKIFITVPVALINDILDLDLEDDITNVTKFACNKLIFECAYNYLKDDLNVDSLKMDDEIIEDPQKIEYSLENETSRYDDFMKVNFPVVISNCIYYVSTYFKLKVMLRILNRKIVLNPVCSDSYYKSQNCYAALGGFNLTPDQLNNLKAGDIIDIKQTVAEKGWSVIKLYLDGKLKAKAIPIVPEERLKKYKVLVWDVLNKETVNKDNFNSFVVLGNAIIEEEDKQLEKRDLISLDTCMGDYLPLVYENKIVAQVYLVPVKGKVLVKIVKVLKNPVSFIN